jgi:hypothetical protein
VIDVEPVIRTHLDRLAPLPDASRRNWADVVDRAHRRRRKLGRVLVVALAPVCAAGTLLVAGPALGFRPIGDVLGSEPTPSWTWPEGVPGEPVEVPNIVRDANDQLGGRLRRDRVDLSTVRQIVSAGAASAQNAFLAARGLNGDVCLAKVGAGGHMGTPFECLHDPPRPGVPSSDEQAVFVGASAGGHRGSVVDYSTLIGVARADVGRVELELVNGEKIDLPLNRWRGFGYYTTDPQRFPKTLSVYRTWSFLFQRHEKLVGELPLQRVQGLTPTPLCGGDLGPCPPGVKP